MKWQQIITNLLKIKSLVTILTTAVFCFLLITGAAIPQEFIMIYTSIIAFYFGTQTQKNQELYEDGKRIQPTDDGANT